MLSKLINRIVLPCTPRSYDHQLPGLRSINHVPVMHVKQPAHQRQGIIVFLHGNNTDLGGICRFVYRLSDATHMDVIAPEYPGYGLRSHEHADIGQCIETARHIIETVSRMYIDEPMIVAGRSIGTAIVAQALRTGSPVNLRGIVLISPFTSLNDMIPFGHCILPADLQLNTRKALGEIDPNASVTIIHGVDDRLIPIHHALQLQNVCLRAQLIVMSGGHNDLDVPRLLDVFRVLSGQRKS